MTNILFIMDPIASVNPKKDSTLAMMIAAQKKEWQLYYAEQQDLYVDNGVPFVTRRSITIDLAKDNWYQLGTAETTVLSDSDVVMMRKDPPFDNEYIYSTYILELAEKLGSLIVNKPQSLRDANEKLFTAWFPECTPDTVVSRRADILRDFIAKHQIGRAHV